MPCGARWSIEYLRGLRERHNQKHKKSSFTVAKGDVVIISIRRSEIEGNGLSVVVEELYKGTRRRRTSSEAACWKDLLRTGQLNQLYPLKLSCYRSVIETIRTTNPDARDFRPTRDAAVAAREEFKKLWTISDKSRGSC